MRAAAAFVIVFCGLALGCVIWLGFFQDTHEFKRELRQEDRKAEFVGAAERPASKIKVQVLKRDCTVITNATLDGEDMTVYARNDCHQQIRYMEYRWQTIAPNGTAIGSGYTNTANCAIPMMPGKLAECSIKVGTDDRIDTVMVWTER